MAYQVIARKYRPQRFNDVVGQEHVTNTLANAIRKERIAHAFLFVGPRGTGKTTIARIFAKCLNCTDGPNAEFAEDDPKCEEITQGRSLDVLEIDGASNRGIEEIRELRDTVKYAPATSKFKIYIIDEVHMLTKEAFNALLKTLEEPPEHVKFMFATTEAEKVLPTILSRCQRFDLRRIPVPLIAKHLTFICTNEGVEADELAVHAVARGADGCMRDAESALDQLISFCGNKVTEEDVLSMFGLTAQAQVMNLAAGILESAPQKVLEELNSLTRQGKDLGRLLSDLLQYFRNLLIYLVSKGDLGLLEASEMEAASFKTQSQIVDDQAMTRIMEVLTQAEGRFRDAASKKIFVEVTLLKAIQAKDFVSIDTVLKQLEKLQDGAPLPTVSSPQRSAPAQPQSTPRVSSPSNSGPTPPPQTASPPAPPEPPISAPIPQGTVSPSDNGDVQILWRQLLDAVGKASAFTRSYLVEAHPVSLQNHVFTIGFDPEFADQLDLVNNQRTHTLIQTKLKELGHPKTQIKFVKAEAPVGHVRLEPATPPEPVPEKPSPAPTPTASDSSPPPSPVETEGEPASPAPKPPPMEKIDADEFKNDPLIKKALELFKGQIVEVRA